MPIIVYDILQGTEPWHKLKAGIPSGTGFSKIVTLKGDRVKNFKTYLYKVAAEIIAGPKDQGRLSADMLRGIEFEDEARKCYELDEDVDVVCAGFIFADERRRYGVSPDGLVGENGLIEIKCPTLPIHIKYIDEAKLPNDYFQQVQGQLLVSGREWVDFFSYYPDLDTDTDVPNFKLRVYRDEIFIEKLRAELEIFVEELDKLVEKLRAM